MNVCRFRIAPSRVAVGQLASQYGVACAMCIYVGCGSKSSEGRLGRT